MRSITALFLLFLTGGFAPAQSPAIYADYFTGQALRIEYDHQGDAKEELITLHRMLLEPAWPGNPATLLPVFEYGRYRVSVYDVASNLLLFRQGFDCLFGEYKTTTPALNGVKRNFRRAIRIPCPKKPARLLIERRDRENVPHPLLATSIDPADYHIIRETPRPDAELFEIQISGETAAKVDLLFLAEGYTAAERDKFKADLGRFTGYLFSIEPYTSLRDRFNVRGIFLPSAESGTDEPRQGIYRNTVLNSSFNAFDLDRYLLTEDQSILQALAGQAPCDAPVILVNSKRYGGGGVYNDYAVTTVDHAASRTVFLHEFGHSFAGLADEYYASDVSYNDFYPKGVEPLEPNITALLDSGRIKWRELLSPGITLPTEYGKDRQEELRDLRRQNREQQREAEAQAKKAGQSDEAVKQLLAPYAAKDQELQARAESIRKEFSHLYDQVGAFEGAGYSSKGLYRPMMYCLMINHPKNEFCLVCQQAIRLMTRHYAGQ